MVRSRYWNIRRPAVAGLFYPSDPKELEDTVVGLLADARSRAAELAGHPPGSAAIDNAGRPRIPVVIAPHAGYVYSGPVAATAYATLCAALQDRGSSYRRVAIFGPSHRVPLRGMALPSAARFEMPGFELEADPWGMNVLQKFPWVAVDDAPHLHEHSIEVHFPFVRWALGVLPVVAVAVGEARPEEVGEAMQALLEDPRCLVVVSTDLSHYLDYETALRVDAFTAEAIEELRYEDIGYDHACGRNGLRGLLYTAKNMRLLPQRLDLRNSGDTAGSRESVVGYPAFAFWRSRQEPDNVSSSST